MGVGSNAVHTHLPNLLVLRSLGKFFGLAGARVGFLLAEKNVLKKAQEALGPWAVNGASRFIAIHALNNLTWQADTRTTLSADSLRLKQLLTQYGLMPNGGTDLFQFVMTAQSSAIHQALAKQGVWVRLFESALRFGLPEKSDWNKLEQALQNTNNT